MEYEDLLEAWGLADYKSTFIDEGIDDSSFPLLDSETINILFKKIGPRLVFKSKYYEYLKSKTPLYYQEESTSVLSALEKNEDLGSSSSCVSNSLILEADDEIKSIISTSSSNSIILPQYETILSDVNETSTTVAKKLRLDVPRDSIFLNGLENLLKKSTEGLIALSHRHKLNNDDRQKISKIIVNELISLKQCNALFDIKADIFKKAASEIVQLFPGESVDSYYMPYSSPKEGLRKQPARGKLWSRFVNLKTALRLAECQSDHSSCNKENVEEDLTAKQHLLFLNTAIEPYQKVLQYWESTFKIRTQLYKKASIDKIFNDFPALRTNFGLELLESDFNKLYADKINIIYSQWPNVSKAILAEIKDRNIKLEDTDRDTSLHALLALPHLFSPVTVKKSSRNKSGNWRPTRVEVQESFFIYSSDLAGVNDILQKRALKLEELGIPLQPFGAAVGSCGKETYYVIVNEKTYNCESSIRCLELLFIVFHALNLEYPLESKHVWQFVQEVVFKMSTSNKSSSTACVIADVNYHLQKL